MQTTKSTAEQPRSPTVHIQQLEAEHSASPGQSLTDNLHITEPFQPTNFNFPKKTFGKQNRSFQSKWFNDFPWLHYNEQSDSVLCFICAQQNVNVGTLNAQLEIFKLLMKEGEFTCLDDIQAKMKTFSEAEKSMISEIITICNLLLVNPATSAAGERSFSSARRLKTWLRSTMTQTRFSNLTILNTHKERTDNLCLIDIANEFTALNDNRRKNFGTFKESDFKISG